MTAMNHEIRCDHRRTELIRSASLPSSDSTVSIEATSEDLVEAWRELLSRMPNDLYAALKAAMRETR